MAELCSAAFGGRWSLAVLRPPSLHCQRQRAVAAVAGTCSSRRQQGCSCPSRQNGEAAAIPVRRFRSRCRQQQRARGRRCCLCAPGSAAASGNEHESARPRLLLHAQLLCKCCFFPPPSPLHASGAVSQLLSPSPMLSRLPQIRPVLEARLCADPPALDLPSLACRPPAKGDPLFPPTCRQRTPWPLAAALLPCPGPRARQHPAPQVKLAGRPQQACCATQAPAGPCLELENYCERAADPRGALCSCRGCGVQGRGGVCKTPSRADAAGRELQWKGVLGSASFIAWGKGVFLLRGDLMPFPTESPLPPLRRTRGQKGFEGFGRWLACEESKVQSPLPCLCPRTGLWQEEMLSLLPIPC